MVKSARSRRSPRKGFTLIELLVVVAVIAVMAGLAAPAIGRAMAERRANQAMVDVMRLLRRARSEAAAYGRAHLLQFFAADGGSMQLYRGRNNGCNSNNWVAIIDSGCDGNAMCVGQVAMTTFARGDSSITMAEAGGGNVFVCFQPSGATMWFDGVTFAGATPPTTGFVFSLTPRDGYGAERGVIRRVALPFGGDARVLR